MGYLDIYPAPLRKHEVPAAVKTLISTSRMNELLYGSGRVYTETEQPTDPEDKDKSKPWGRVVIILADRLYPSGQAMPGREEVVLFLVRAEVNRPAPDFDYTQALEAILEEAFKQLNGQELTLAKAAKLLSYFRGDVNKRPIWDTENGVWLKTREFRTVLKPVSA